MAGKICQFLSDNSYYNSEDVCEARVRTREGEDRRREKQEENEKEEKRQVHHGDTPYTLYWLLK